MQKQPIILIIAVILALATVVLVKVYIGQQIEKRSKEIMQEANRKVAGIKASLEADQISVLVAKKNIPAGSIIDAGSIDMKIVSNQFVQPQAARSLERVVGMMTTAPISSGEQLTLGKLTYSKTQTGGLAQSTPIGKRAITVEVDELRGVAGMVQPGDYVDIMVSLSVPVVGADGKQAVQAAVIPLFQNVLVLAIGQQTGPALAGSPSDARYQKAEKKGMSPLITLALSPQEANLAAFVQEQGKISLVLRSPADSQTHEVQPATWEMLFQYIMPKEAAKQEAGKKEEAGPYVEIYRGMTKQKIPLSQE